MPIFFENVDCCAIFSFQHFQKGTFRTICFAQKSSVVNRRVEGKRPCRDPAFHETIIITVPLIPTGFLQVVF